VRCDVDVLESREANRKDRIPGTAAAQAEIVHSYGPYDIEVRTDQLTPRDAATRIVSTLHNVGPTTAFDRLR
jgi:chloramphenicol 3-O phosphotransferase